MYKLADGTMSTDYKVGDKFVVAEVAAWFQKGDIITLSVDDMTSCPFFDAKEYACHWFNLKAYKPKGFTKSDLKDGMVVTYREGETRLVFRDSLLITSTGSQGSNLVSFYDNLTHTEHSEMDIVKVEYMDELLWERIEDTPEQKEIKRLQGIIKEAQDALNLIGKGE